MKRTVVPASVLLVGAPVLACTPEAGCGAMGEMPTDDWTANQAADFARHCLLKAPTGTSFSAVKRVRSAASVRPPGDGCQ
jgi:hypothetical protein